jgi:prepilin-type N-terminal cleavage/methylation domain-containing protein
MVIQRSVLKMFYHRKEQVMKKGFTLIELMIVIIIIGVLATVGIVQYQAAVEKSRGAEARSILGALRSTCAPIWMEFNGTDNCIMDRLGMGAGTGLIPTACTTTNFFSYAVANQAVNSGVINITATRCTAGGKTPNSNAATAGTVKLSVNYVTGSDVWNTTGNY